MFFNAIHKLLRTSNIHLTLHYKKFEITYVDSKKIEIKNNNNNLFIQTGVGFFN